jgi:S1-C subfamily serine protease
LKFLKFLAFYNFNVSNSNNIINLFEEYKGYLKYESKSDFQFFLNALFLSYIKFEPTESIQEKFEKFLDYIFESQNINDLDNINLDQISNNIWGLIEKYNDQIKNQSSPLTDDLKNKINNISVNIFNDETAGSGFIFSIDKENGILYMATNRHCVVKDKRDPNSKEKVDYLKLKIINEASPFTIQKENIFLPEDKKDMAIIRLKNDKFKNTSQFDGIKIDQNIKKGDFVISAGNSLGLYTQDDEKNITFGRIIDIHKDTIEHSCAIFHGNSGGPLFNSNGDIIGINTSGRMSASAQLITNLIKFFDKIKNEVQIDKNYQEFQQSKIELNKLEEHRNEHSQVL